MTTTTAARVDVLTAEVRVLMVGSRQVTMSVYNQLDEVEPGDLDPFGRVAPRDAHSDYVYVVGASARDADRGTLVRSRDRTADAWRRHAGFCRSYLVPLAREREDLEPKLAEELSRFARSPLEGQIAQLDWKLGGFAGWTAAEIAETARDADDAAEAARWEALPLIVLAGLR